MRNFLWKFLWSQFLRIISYVRKNRIKEDQIPKSGTKLIEFWIFYPDYLWKKLINRTDPFNNHRLEISLKCIFVFKNIISDFELLRNIGGRDDLQKGATYIKM